MPSDGNSGGPGQRGVPLGLGRPRPLSLPAGSKGPRPLNLLSD